jgi:uncharacterized protein (UPF0548 family)
VRPTLLARVDEAWALEDLRHRQVNYDPAQAPVDGRPQGHWHVDSGATLIGQEPPGDPVRGGPWEMACLLVSQYEFADERILRAVYRQDQDLLGRDMLLEGRFYGLRFYFGVRVTGVFDETRDTGRAQERVWGWCYQTLRGHLEQGEISFEVIKHLATGQIAFRVTGYSRAARIPDPLVRLGFRLFGRWTQQRYYAAVQRRLYHLIQRAQQGAPLPEPAVRADGLVLAPTGTRPHPLDRLAVSWLYPGL